MLFLDHMINADFERAYELFDMYAKMPMWQEFQWINKVLDVIGSDSAQADFKETDLNLEEPKNAQLVTKTLDRY